MKNKKPIAILMSDPHLDDNNYSQVFNITLQIVDLAKNIGVDIICLGDWFTNRSNQRLTTLLNFNNIVNLLSEVGCYAIAGNHDKADQTIDESYLTLYVSDKFRMPDVVNFDSDVVGYFLSYYSEEVFAQKLQKIVDNLDSSKHNVLFTHYGIDGVLNNDKISISNSVKSNNFKKFDKVFIGHYHNASNPTKNIHYIGSTDPRNFGEDNEKGVVVLYNDLSFDCVKLDFKHYEKIIVDNIDIIELQKISDYCQNTDKNIKIEFKGSKENLQKIDKRTFQNLGVKIEMIDISNIQIQSIDECENSIDELKMGRSDVIKHFIEYCDNNSIERKKSAKILKCF